MERERERERDIERDAPAAPAAAPEGGRRTSAADRRVLLIILY